MLFVCFSNKLTLNFRILRAISLRYFLLSPLKTRLFCVRVCLSCHVHAQKHKTAPGRPSTFFTNGNTSFNSASVERHELSCKPPLLSFWSLSTCYFPAPFPVSLFLLLFLAPRACNPSRVNSCTPKNSLSNRDMSRQLDPHEEKSRAQQTNETWTRKCHMTVVPIRCVGWEETRIYSHERERVIKGEQKEGAPNQCLRVYSCTHYVTVCVPLYACMSTHKLSVCFECVHRCVCTHACARARVCTCTGVNACTSVCSNGT